MSEKTLRVLHVDDQHLWRSTVSDYLGLFGRYEITSAESGEEALNLLRNTSFDIIISDYQMPEMNGIELLLQIRRRGESIPFILLTGIKQEELEQKARDSGADFYVVKTGDPSLVFSDLSQKIQLAVARSDTVQELKNYQKQHISSPSSPS